ncbi:MAG: molybdopterin cofactor-binding domain-containing protein [Polymorphobacter sp.]|uniref:xanthine dehydrogenase family protein molybdopterin-binding subunit n=1 Tax=Polymorphobacter sp. TaxID=1909290 RepID=UPI003A83F7EE
MRGQEPMLSRRALLQLVGGSGLCLAAKPALLAEETAAGSSGTFSVYLSIRPDGRIEISTPNAEMGQGTYDALAKIVAEELDADWAHVDIILSGANPDMANPHLRSQTTGNSEAVRGYWPILRETGAAARIMLVAAAAARWGVSPDDCTTAASLVRHGSKSLAYGELAGDAVRLPIPVKPALKPRADWTLLGRDLPRKETAAKVRGSAVFGIDVRMPGMMVAALAMPDAAWGDFDADGLEAARAAPGVRTVAPVLGGHAVIAPDFWTAQTAARLISYAPKSAEAALPSSDALEGRIAEALADDSAPAVLFSGVGGGTQLEGSRAAVAAAADGARLFDARYTVPWLAHGALEPLACTALFEGNALRVWVPSQAPKAVADMAARLTGLKAEQINIHRTFLGGGFGRKWNTDFAQQAIEAAMAVPGTPVKVIWNRQQDGGHDFYRPAVHGSVRASLDDGGRITSWSNVVAGQSLTRRWQPYMKADAPDNTLQKPLPYAVGAVHLESRAVDLPVPIGWWRSVAHAPTCFFIETAMDEMAALTGNDPLAYRLQHLDDARARAVLIALGKVMDWPQPKQPGMGQGIALSAGYESWCAIGVSVRLTDNALTIERIAAVVDCGLALEPENVRRQIIGGIVFGLGAALDGKVSFSEGQASVSGIVDLGALSPAGMPEIMVELIGDHDAPGGVGEVGTPGIAPALCNAIAAAGGARLRALPVSAAGISVTV